jgi:putative membrane protein
MPEGRVAMGSMMTGMGMGLWSAVSLLLLVLVLIVAAVSVTLLAMSAARTPLPSGGRGHGPDGAREILRRRYAAGEIDEDEFWRRMSGISAA